MTAIKKSSPFRTAGKLALGALGAGAVAYGAKKLFGRNKSGKRRHKKSLMWYVKERARLKAKKAYERVRLMV